MKFLANENFSLASVRFLREEGFDVKSTSETYPGISDMEVLEIAINENRTILTHDSDYGKIIFTKGIKPKMGVIYFRLNKFEPKKPATFLIEILKNDFDTINKLTVIDKNSIRQRAY